MINLSSLNILYIGSLEKSSNSFKRFETLKAMGNNVEGINVDSYIFGTKWMRFHFHLYIGPGIFLLSKDVLQKVDFMKPDLIWVDNKPYLRASTLKKIRSRMPSAKIVNVLTDDPFGKYNYAWRFIYNTFKYYDVHFVQREINIPELKRQGAKRVETCFRSFDPSFHRILFKDAPELARYKTSVGFIGSYEKDREEYIAYLVEQGIPVSITGDGWTKGKYWTLLKPFYKGPSVYGDEYIKTINGMDVALHFLRKANRDQQDSRTFEIPACGTFMLAERSHLHINFFKEGEEVDFFTSKEELLQKVRYYINQPELRLKMAKAAYERSFQSGYYHESRLKMVLEKIYSNEINVKKFNRIITGIYIDPDFYPPTINAIINFSEIAEEVVVVTRNHSLHNFPYPSNVTLIKKGKLKTVMDTEKKNILYKLMSFLRFTLALWWQSNKNGTRIVIYYDSIPLFSYFITRIFTSKKKIFWYHNHDMPGTHLTRKFSVGWFSGKFEHEAMRHVDYFSLPSDDRMKFYPGWSKPEKYFLIPNYPSLKVYQKKSKIEFIDDEIRIIFQGTIGSGHALEEMTELLKKRINNKSLRLILKGSVRTQYKNKINQLAASLGVSDRLEWKSLGPYCELPSLTKSCHIGIAIHMGTDNVRKTLGTASNKIYEYAACGLPVILYDNEQFRKYLNHQSWAYFTDGTTESLENCIREILDDYECQSYKSRNSFEENLNYEHAFSGVMNYLQKK
jgi:glycosyltransferase involved in cell wall biosynthesis